MRIHPRRARVDTRSPRAWGTSDRNGMVGQHDRMCWQYDWAGLDLVNKRVLVHPDELDKPQRQLGTINISPDPMPIVNARPEQYTIDENIITLTASATITATGCIVSCDGTFLVTIGADAASNATHVINLNNDGTGTVSIATVNGTTISLAAGAGTSIIASSTGWNSWQGPWIR